MDIVTMQGALLRYGHHGHQKLCNSFRYRGRFANGGETSVY